MKTFPRIILLSSLLLLLLTPFPAGAAINDQSYGDQFLAQVANVGTLPNSPFYFFKEWGRDIRMFFIISPTKKAQYELRVIDEKAAELSKLEQSDIRNKEEVIKKTTSNYESSIKSLKSRLERLDGSEDEDIQGFVKDIEGKLQIHQSLFEDLSAKYQEAIEELDGLKKELKDTLEENKSLEEKLKTRLNEATKQTDSIQKETKPEVKKVAPDNEPIKSTNCKDGYVKDQDGVCNRLPDYSHVDRTDYKGWSCNTGYCWTRESLPNHVAGDYLCLKKPSNSACDRTSVTAWSCLSDYVLSSDEKSCVSRKSTTCKEGYFKDYEGVCNLIPSHAHADRTDSRGWYCDSGYIESSDGRRCDLKVNPPTIQSLQAKPTKGGGYVSIYEFSWSSSDSDYCELVSKVDSFFTGKSRNSSGSVSIDLGPYRGREVSVSLGCFGEGGEVYETLRFLVN